MAVLCTNLAKHTRCGAQPPLCEGVHLSLCCNTEVVLPSLVLQLEECSDFLFRCAVHHDPVQGFQIGPPRVRFIPAHWLGNEPNALPNALRTVLLEVLLQKAKKSCLATADQAVQNNQALCSPGRFAVLICKN